MKACYSCIKILHRNTTLQAQWNITSYYLSKREWMKISMIRIKVEGKRMCFLCPRAFLFLYMLHMYCLGVWIILSSNTELTSNNTASWHSSGCIWQLWCSSKGWSIEFFSQCWYTFKQRMFQTTSIWTLMISLQQLLLFFSQPLSLLFCETDSIKMPCVHRVII